MAGRVTQTPLEVVVSPTSQKARVSQVAVEAVISPTSVNAIVSQAGLEAVVSPTSQNAVVTQFARQTAIEPVSPAAHVTQVTRQALLVPAVRTALVTHISRLTLLGGWNPEIHVTKVARLTFIKPNPPVTHETTFAAAAWIQATRVFGTHMVAREYHGAPLAFYIGGSSRSPVETVFPDCDLTIVGTPITARWDVWQSHFQWGVDKKEVVHFRRDSVTGLIMWTDDPQRDETDAGNAATGMQWHFSGSYTESARSGRYVLSVLPTKGNATLYTSSLWFSLSVPGYGPGMTVDAVLIKLPVSRTFSVAATVKTLTPVSGGGIADAVLSGPQATSVASDAVLFIWGLGAFFASALVVRPTSGSFTVGAQVRAIPERTMTANAVVGRTTESSFLAEWSYNSSHFYVSAWKRETVGPGVVVVSYFPVDAIIPGSGAGTLTLASIHSQTFAQTLSLDALVLGENAGSTTLDAVALGPVPSSFGVDAFFGGGFSLSAVVLLVGICTWTTPGDTVVIGQNENLVFLIPSAGGHMHFEIQLDRVATFDSPELRVVKSHRDPGWEYWDGAWLPIPLAGVDPAFAGNEARHTIPDPLLGGPWYRRVRAGVI